LFEATPRGCPGFSGSAAAQCGWKKGNSKEPQWAAAFPKGRGEMSRVAQEDVRCVQTFPELLQGFFPVGKIRSEGKLNELEQQGFIPSFAWPFKGV